MLVYLGLDIFILNFPINFLWIGLILSPKLAGVNNFILSRAVTQSSSVYKLKDANGKDVGVKKVREELERILLAFNIQVNNPIAVLNQDTAKTFLFKVR